MKGRVYLDYNASAPLRPEARAAMLDCLDTTGNASSVHSEGRALRAVIDGARGPVADLVNASPQNVVFTSGATESANLALTPEIEVRGEKKRASRLYVSAVEHPCVLAGGRFGDSEIVTVPVSTGGIIDLDALQSELESHDAEAGVPFVAVQLANSETGVIQPVDEVGKMVRAAGGVLLYDAVQAAGRIPVDIAALGADFVIVSSHKIGGPQGAGALVLCDAGTRPAPHLLGGFQENRMRAGTENAAAIAGFGAAAISAKEELGQGAQLEALRNELEAALALASGAGAALTVFGSNSARLPNTSLFAVDGLAAETALIAFDLAGFAVSSGSACSSGKVGASHVLQAMGVNAGLARCALRVSLGWNTKKDDIAAFAAAFGKIAGRVAKAA